MTTCMRVPGSNVAVKFGESVQDVGTAVRNAINSNIIATFGSDRSIVIVNFSSVMAVELTLDLPDGMPSVGGSVAEMQR
jgi:hypothetical protein